MSEAITSSGNGILYLPKIYGLLNGLEECDTDQTLSRLKAVMTLVTESCEMCNHFCKLGGVQTVVNYLCSEDKSIVEVAFFILAICAHDDKGTRIELAKEQVFAILSKALQDLNHCSYKLAPCIIFLIASIIQGSGIGQTLVRESMCQYHLVVVFHRLLQLMTFHSLREEELILTWTSLCLAMRYCVANPQNEENQYQLGLVLPKALGFINDCFANASCGNSKGFVECLIALLTDMISNNVTNQLSFSIYHGMPVTIRAIDLMETSEDSSSGNGNVLETLIYLLDASIYENTSNCTLAIRMGAMPILIKVLHKLNNKHKIAAMVTLGHMVGMNAQCQKEFEKYNGVGAIALAMVNADESPEVRQAANCLLHCNKNISIDMIYPNYHSPDEQVNQSQQHYKLLHYPFGSDSMNPTQFKIINTANLNGHPERFTRISHHNNLPNTVHYSTKMNKQSMSNKSSDTHHTQLSNIIEHSMYSRNVLAKGQFDNQHSDEQESNEETSNNETKLQQNMSRINDCDENIFVKPRPPTQYKCNKNKMYKYQTSIPYNNNGRESQSANPTVKRKPQHHHRLGTNSTYSKQQSSNGTIINSKYGGQECVCNVRHDATTATIGTPQLKHLKSQRDYEQKPCSCCSYSTTPKSSSSLMEDQSHINLTDYSPAASLRTEYNGMYSPACNGQIGDNLNNQNIPNDPRETEHNQDSNSVETQSSNFKGSKHVFKEVSNNHQVQSNISRHNLSTQCTTTNLAVQRRSKIKQPPYSEEEIKDLENGVFTYGMNFKAILAAYKFHPARSSADLLLKWKSS